MNDSEPRDHVPSGSAAFEKLLVLPALVVLLGLVARPVLAQNPPKPLNDTGQVTCYNAGYATGTVAPGTPAPEEPGFEGQDCSQGRSAADALGALPKVGSSGVKGRDYTKICMSGEAAGEGSCPADPIAGEGPNDWACTRDNVTRLIWEVKVNDASHMRHSAHLYAWYDTDAAVNGGDAGAAGEFFTCNGTLGTNLCNTTNFRNAVNALTGANRLCGAVDWRLPTARELQSILDYQPAGGAMIDPAFPNTAKRPYWSGENYARDAMLAWVVDFDRGGLAGDVKVVKHSVRLVRSGP